MSAKILERVHYLLILVVLKGKSISNAIADHVSPDEDLICCYVQRRERAFLDLDAKKLGPLVGQTRSFHILYQLGVHQV